MEHRTESGLYVPAHMKAKAVTGQIDAMMWGTHVKDASRNPQRLMREAQSLFHTNPWVGTAERTIVGKLTGLPWHLEDGGDGTIEDGPAFDLMDQPLAYPQGGLRTRRELWSLTARHVGLCGNSFWYGDQADALSNAPLKFLYINPARMWPAVDDVGNLTGWVLDATGTGYNGNPLGGVPLEREFVFQFVLDPPDSGHFGIGIVERAWGKADLSTLADHHARGVLASGGRLSGMVAPKDGTLDDDAYKALVREFRSIVSDPDAAKRLLITRGPVDFTTTAATPEQMDLTSMQNTSRDDIFAIWQVPPSQAGVPGAGGLNSGETKKYDEAVLHQNAVHPRVVAFRETLQVPLDRFRSLGQVVELVIEEPTFDDDTPKYELATKAKDLPVTRDEIRAILGLDPLGPENGGNIIDMPANMLESGQAPMKARLTPAKLRERADKRFVPAVKKAMAAFLAGQRAEIAKRVRTRAEHIAKKPSDVRVWWDQGHWDTRLAKVLKPFAIGIAETVTPNIAQSLGRKADTWQQNVQGYVSTRSGERITLINQTTRDLIAAALIKAVEDGMSPGQLADLFDGLPAFDEYRSELVARTETMLAYNDATLRSYMELDVEKVEAIDGDQDDECAERNGRVYTVDEAQTITDHPNGTLDWAPVIGKAWVPANGGSSHRWPDEKDAPRRTVIEYDEQGRAVAVVG